MSLFALTAETNRRGTPPADVMGGLLGQARSSLTALQSLAGASVIPPMADRLMTFAGMSIDPSRRPEDRVQQFAFQINPQRLRRSRRKVQSSIYLGKEEAQSANPFVSAYDFHYQGLQFEIFQYDGVTPAFSPLATQTVPIGGTAEREEWQDYTRSPGWQWFLQFRDFFDEFADTLTVMKYLDQFHIGVLDDLRFVRDAKAPFNIHYSFGFRSFFDYSLAISVTPLDMVYDSEAGGVNPTTNLARGELIRKFIVQPRDSGITRDPQANMNERPIQNSPVFSDYLASVKPMLQSTPT